MDFQSSQLRVFGFAALGGLALIVFFALPDGTLPGLFAGAMMLALGIMILSLPVRGLAWVISRVVARRITPPQYIRYGRYDTSEAYDSLVREGYGVSANWSSDAVQALMKKRVQSS
jgi:hypothetical protein